MFLKKLVIDVRQITAIPSNKPYCVNIHAGAIARVRKRISAKNIKKFGAAI